MVILSTTYENRAFDSLTLAEIYGIAKYKKNNIIISYYIKIKIKEV